MGVIECRTGGDVLKLLRVANKDRGNLGAYAERIAPVCWRADVVSHRLQTTQRVTTRSSAKAEAPNVGVRVVSEVLKTA